MLSYIPTYKDEPSAHGRCELEARRSVHPERMQVGALTSIWQVGVPPAEAQGVDSANSLFYKKVRSNISHGFTYSILLSTTSQQRPGCQQYENQRFHNSMDLQPMTTSYCRHSPSLSREENVLHASVNQLLHSYPLQEENIPLYTVPNPIGICRQQTKFATFTLSLQRGKYLRSFPSVQLLPVNDSARYSIKQQIYIF